jgi:hypothetical protein
MPTDTDTDTDPDPLPATRRAASWRATSAATMSDWQNR